MTRTSRRSGTWVVLLLLMASMLCFLGASAAVAYDGTVKVYLGPYQYSSGGEFDVDVLTWTYAGGNPWTLVSSGKDFQTFCVEKNETFVPTALYNVTVATQTIATGKQLTNETAWLFHEWNSGNLSGYDYSNGLGQREADAGQLQHALWALMTEEAAPVGGDALTWYNLAMGSGANGIGNVRILQLFTTDTSGRIVNAQDMLVEVVPEPGTLVASFALLAPGAISLVRLRRMKKSNK